MTRCWRSPLEQLRRRGRHRRRTEAAPISFPGAAAAARRTGPSPIAAGQRYEWRTVARGMADGTSPRAIEKGLEHVVMGESRIALVGEIRAASSYRGFDIEELVQHALLRGGCSPTSPRATRRAPRSSPAWRASFRGCERSPDGARAVLAALPTDLPPLEALRTLISSLGDGRAFAYPPTREQGLALVAQVPLLLAGYVRRTRGQEPLAPVAGLGHVGQYLYLLTGRRPDPGQVRALEAYFILLADHGMNASTFALRVVLSTHVRPDLRRHRGPRRPQRPAARRRPLEGERHARRRSAP